MVVDINGNLKSRKVDPKIDRNLLATIVINHDLPYSFVEYDEFKAHKIFES